MMITHSSSENHFLSILLQSYSVVSETVWEEKNARVGFSQTLICNMEAAIPGGSFLSHYSGTLSHGDFWRLPFPAAHSSVITVARSVMVISGGCPFPGAHSSVITAARSVMVISGGCPLPGLIPQSLQWHAQSW